MTGGTHPYDDLKAYCDGELTLMRGLRVRLHLARCASCREETMFMRDLETDLRADSGAMPLDPALRARILAEAANIPRSALTPPVRPRLRLAPIYAAVSLSAAAILSVVVVIDSASIFHTGRKAAKIASGVQIARNIAPPLIADSQSGFGASMPPSGAVGLPPAPSAETDHRSRSARYSSGHAGPATRNPIAIDGSNNDLRHSVSAKTPPVTLDGIGPAPAAPQPSAVAAVAPDIQVPKFVAGRIASDGEKFHAPGSATPAYAVPSPPPPSAPQLPPPSVPKAAAEANRPMGEQDSAGQNPTNGTPDGGLAVNGAITVKSAVAAPAASDRPGRYHQQAMLSLQVADPEGRSGTITQVARDLGGVAESNTSSIGPDGSRSETLVFYVPDVQLGSFIDIVSKLGAVTSRQITTVDSIQNLPVDKGQKTIDAIAAQETVAGLDKGGPSNDNPTRHSEQKIASATVTVVLMEKTK